MSHSAATSSYAATFLTQRSGDTEIKVVQEPSSICLAFNHSCSQERQQQHMSVLELESGAERGWDGLGCVAQPFIRCFNEPRWLCSCPREAAQRTLRARTANCDPLSPQRSQRKRSYRAHQLRYRDEKHYLIYYCA
ncbi:uncharacterized protein V6R79_006808 [Siganus canaliculatus]